MCVEEFLGGLRVEQQRDQASLRLDQGSHPSATLITRHPCAAMRCAAVVIPPSGPSLRGSWYCASVSLYAHGGR